MSLFQPIGMPTTSNFLVQILKRLSLRTMRAGSRGMPGNARPRTTMMKRPSYGFGISRDRLLAGESVSTALSRQLYRARIESPYWPASCRCDGILAMCGRFGSEVPQCGSGDEVALKVEGVVNRTVHAQEALGGSSRLEPLQLALASSDCLMRILRPIALPKPLLMPAGQSQAPERRGVGA